MLSDERIKEMQTLCGSGVIYSVEKEFALKELIDAYKLLKSRHLNLLGQPEHAEEQRSID